MIFNRLCHICGCQLAAGERTVCIACIGRMPLWNGLADELRLQRFDRTSPVSDVRPWLTYYKSHPVGQLIRKGKFSDRPDLIEALAELYANHLVNTAALADIDAIVPVPMHWFKRLLRGYNQAEIIAEKISRAAAIPVVKAIKAQRSHSVQSRLSADKRAINLTGTFSLTKTGKSLPSGMKIALVDDILTTGATLREAIRAISAKNPAKIAIMTLAATPNL